MKTKQEFQKEIASEYIRKVVIEDATAIVVARMDGLTYLVSFKAWIIDSSINIILNRKGVGSFSLNKTVQGIVHLLEEEDFTLEVINEHPDNINIYKLLKSL